MMNLSEADPKGNETPKVMMMADRCALGPLRRDLLPLYHRWINDVSTQRTLGTTVRPFTLEEEQAWYDARVTAAGRTAESFTIYERESMQPIGTTSWDEINYHHRTATFGILIGESAYRGRGLGTEVTRLMLDYAFTALGLHNVLLTVWEFNLAGLRAYTKAGFRECGRRHQCGFVAGKWWDLVYMECLSTDFVSSWLRKALDPDDTQRASQGKNKGV
jgi:RimJ/RimL family protein N-acetyltransferase